MKYTFENLRKISQNEYESHTVDHIENITTDDDMEGKTTVEKQEHLCGTLGLYGTQSQINLGVMVLEELRELEQQNKRYREALEFYAKRGHYIASGYPDTELQAIEFGEIARKALESDNGDN